MTVVFIGGSRKARLNAAVRGRIDAMVSQGHDIVVGDANGVDKAVQSYLAAQGYRNVVVYCSGPEPRNNVGAWQVHAVEVRSKKRDRAFYTAKDAQMTRSATHGLMVWDGESVGTLQNVVRLVSEAKPVVLYESPSRTFLTLKSVGDWADFAASRGGDAVAEAGRSLVAKASPQLGLL